MKKLAPYVRGNSIPIIRPMKEFQFIKNCKHFSGKRYFATIRYIYIYIIYKIKPDF